METTLIVTLIVALITAIAGPLLVTRYKDYLRSKTKKEDPVVSSIRLNSLVDEQLGYIKNELNACRVWVSQFHNGGSFLPTGKSISKFSITYEHTNPYVPSLREVFKNLPVSLFNDPLMELYERDEIIIPNYEKNNKFGLNKFASATPPKSTYMFSLKSMQGDFIGTLVVEFVKRPQALNEEQINFLRLKSHSIGTIIGTYLYKTNPY